MNHVTELLSNRKAYIASIDDKIEAAKHSMSSDNPRAVVEYRLLNDYRIELLDGTMTMDEIEEAVDILEEKNPQTFAQITDISR